MKDYCIRHCYVLLCLSGTCLLAACGGDSDPVDTATHLAVSTPLKAVAGSGFQVTVTALDAANKPVPSYSGAVHFSSTDGQAVLPGNSTLPNGAGNFYATLRTAGGSTITVADTVTASIAGSSPSIEVSAGPPTHFSVSAPAAAKSGTPFDITATALDASNNVARSYTGTVHFSSTDVRARVPADSMLTDGVRALSMTLQTAGSESVRASDTVDASMTGLSPSITVSPGPATHFSISAPAAADSGTPLAFNMSARDAAGNVARGYTGSVHFSSSDTQATLPANAPLTNGTGAFSATLRTLGEQTLGATDNVTASITGTSSAIAVLDQLPPTHLSISVPSDSQSGIAFRVRVTALDSADEVVASYMGTLHFSSTDAGALLPTNATLANGAGSFGVTLQAAGAQSITVTDTAAPSLTTTSSPIDVSPGPASRFSVAAPDATRAGSSFSFVVTARDAANNLASGYVGTVHFSSSDPRAFLPQNSALTDGMGNFTSIMRATGPQTITVTDTDFPSVTGTSNTIEVYVSCLTRGEQCPRAAECCPGLICRPASTRAFCE